MRRSINMSSCLIFSAMVVMGLSDICRAVSEDEIVKIQSAAPAQAPAVPKQPRKLLVFSLCEGFKHSSIPYWDKALEIMGQKSGAFAVQVSTDKAIFSEEGLKGFDAICFNNTTKIIFTAEQRDALMNFVKGGKGIVGIHAACDNFDDWPEAAEMMGNLFSGHPWTAGGTWAVKIDEPDHPLNKVFEGKGFKIKDEIYRTGKPFYSRANQRVILSLDMDDQATRTARGVTPEDFDTGLSWVKNFGKGRVFYCSFGHNHDITWTPPILHHILGGVQFALGDFDIPVEPVAQSKADDAAAKVKEFAPAILSYQPGQNRERLTELTDFIDVHKSEPDSLLQIEKALAEMLSSDGSAEGKEFICRQLSLIGTEESVSAIAQLLKNPDMANMALYALERIPAVAADEALRKELSAAKGAVKAGVINTLGVRGDSKSVAAIAECVGDDDPLVVCSSIAALGKIATNESAEVLLKLIDKQQDRDVLVMDAALICADSLSDKGQDGKALEIYHKLYEPANPEHIRCAAMRGIFYNEAEGKRCNLLLEAMRSEQPQLQSSACELVSELKEPYIITAANELEKLPSSAAVVLLAALGRTGSKDIHDVIVNAISSQNADIRIAALNALASAGGKDDVQMLARIAADSSGAQQQAARDALYSLTGAGVDAEIIAGIEKTDWGQAGQKNAGLELVRSAGQRNIISACDVLMKTIAGGDLDVKLECLRALRSVAGRENLSALVNLLDSEVNERFRSELESTIAAVAGRIEDEGTIIEQMVEKFKTFQSINAKVSVIKVFGRLGYGGSLPFIRSLVSGGEQPVRDAATRALIDWPGSETAEDLLVIAEKSPTSAEKILAIRALVNILKRPSGRSDEQSSQMAVKVFALAERNEDKSAVLSILPECASVETLRLAQGCLDNPALKSAAEIAVVGVCRVIAASRPGEAKEALEQIISSTQNLRLRGTAQELLESTGYDK